MVKPQFVVVQSKRDYDREQRDKTISIINIIRTLFVAFLVSIMFVTLVSIPTLSFIFIGSVILFSISDFTRNWKLKSRIRGAFAFYFGFLGIILVIGGPILAKLTEDPKLLIGSLGGLFFLWWSYRDLKKYTHLVDRFKHRYR